MLYVVGGCSRSGKSTLAERVRVRHGIPWFPLDALKMGLHMGAPSYGVHPEDDDLETADRMWPIVRGALEYFLFDRRDYLVEGVNLRPHTITDFIEKAGKPIKVCFLGYPEVAIEDKVAQVAQYKGSPNDWLNRKGPHNVHRHVEISRSLSRRLRDDCARLGIPFIGTGADFHAGIASAERVLMGIPASATDRGQGALEGDS